MPGLGRNFPDLTPGFSESAGVRIRCVLSLAVLKPDDHGGILVVSCLGVSKSDSVRLAILGLTGSCSNCAGNLSAIMFMTSRKLALSSSSFSGEASRSASLSSPKGDLLLSLWVEVEWRDPWTDGVTVSLPDLSRLVDLVLLRLSLRVGLPLERLVLCVSLSRRGDELREVSLDFRLGDLSDSSCRGGVLDLFERYESLSL